MVGRIEVDQLLARREWRGRLSASWFITCNGWQDYTDQLGELLAMSELVYAGQGYCTALASFRSRAAKAYLTAYLDRYLARDDLVYDQRWALGALEYVDATSAEAYRQPNGPWSRWSEATGVKSTASKEIEGLIRLAESLAGDGPALFNL